MIEKIELLLLVLGLRLASFRLASALCLGSSYFDPAKVQRTKDTVWGLLLLTTMFIERESEAIGQSEIMNNECYHSCI